MAASKELVYKGHPLRRKDNIIYFGSMADKYIIMLQILETKKVEDLDVATKVSVQLQSTDPNVKGRDRVVKRRREIQPLRRDGRSRRLAGPRAHFQVSALNQRGPRPCGRR